MCATGLATLPLVRADDDVLVEIGWRVAALALLALVAALVLGWSSLVTASLVLLGGLYGAELAVADAPLDAGAALVAAGLLLTAELGYWSLEERERLKADPGATLRRLAFVAALALGALVLSVLLLALTDGIRASGLAFDLLGAVAAAAALAAVVVLARRQA